MTSKKVKFAITYFSPIHPEMEICRRIEVAAAEVGAVCYFVNENGMLLQTGKHISKEDIDFVIVFDPAQTTLFDIFTYHVMWFVPGLVSAEHAIPYHNFSCNCDDHSCFPSRVALDYYNLVYSNVNPCYLYPSVPKKFMCEPRRLAKGESYKAFYAGINIDSKTVRHEELFKYLDIHNLVDLYGPRSINGKQNWVGFSSYRGEIPFDGSSLMKVANQSGITLALHHEVHARFSMPTNRIFEGIAAGTIVITDRMQFLEENFGDCIFMLDADMSLQEKAKRIHEIINWANEHQDEAIKKIEQSQRIFNEKFELGLVIKNLCMQHTGRKQHLFDKSIKKCLSKSVTVVCDIYDEYSFRSCLSNIRHQDYNIISLLFVIRNSEIAENEKFKISIDELENTYSVNICKLYTQNAYTDRSSHGLLDIISNNVATDLFCFCDANQFWHSNHVRTLVETISSANSDVAYSGSYFINDDFRQIPILYHPVECLDYKILNAFEPRDRISYTQIQREFPRSCFIFSKSRLSSLNQSVFKFINGYEHICLLVSSLSQFNTPAFTGRLTLYFQSNPSSIDIEFDQNLYYRPSRLNRKMSADSLQFALSAAFSRDVSVHKYISNIKAHSEPLNNAVCSYNNDSFLQFARKVKKCLVLAAVGIICAASISMISIIIHFIS